MPLLVAAFGVYSLVTDHSLAVAARRFVIFLVPVSGEQARLMGVVYLGVALMLFANFYAQYHDKTGFYYQWFLVPGALAAIMGTIWCSWIFLAD